MARQEVRPPAEGPGLFFHNNVLPRTHSGFHETGGVAGGAGQEENFRGEQQSKINPLRAGLGLGWILSL